jgi:predicted HTH transcriptional regulator
MRYRTTTDEAKITPKADTPNLLFNLGAGYYKDDRFYLNHNKNVGEKENIVRHINVDKNITIADLAEAIGVTTRTIERNIQKLQSAGRLRRVGPDKGGWWEVEEN